MVAIIFIMLGLLFVGIDFQVITGIVYPAYAHTNQVIDNMGDNIQMYVNKYILWDNVKIDVLPDVIGCVFLLIGVSLLVKKSKKYLFSYLFIILTALFSVGLRALPFFTNGEVRIVACLVVYVLWFAAKIYTEYLVIYTTVSISDDIPNQATNKRMQFGWWITVICRIFIFFLMFVGHFSVMRVYQVVNVAAVLFYLYQFFSIQKYVGTTKIKSWWRIR